MSDPRDILEHFRGRARQMVEVLERLVLIESPSGDAEAISDFVLAYGLLLEDAGVSIREISGPGGPHLFGEMVPAREEVPPVVLVGHSDTVWPRGETARRPPREVDGRLEGPGVYDMRAGLVVMLSALRYMDEVDRPLRRRIQVFLSADEELGSRDAHPHMVDLLSPESVALVLEPCCPDGSIKAWRKGVGMYEIRITGRESHAGNEPEKGVNAIVELARKVLETTSWTDPSRGITVNTGQARGGVATNVVPGFASAGVDLRFERLEDGIEIDARLRSLRADDPRALVSVEGGIIFPPLLPDPRSDRVQRLVIDIASRLGSGIARGKSGGGSDGSFLASRGLAVVDGLGPEGGGAHSREEHVICERLPFRAALLASLLMALDAGDLGLVTK